MINIILYQPEIPYNTGNIMRTCVVSGALLHIIGPIGFKMDDASLKRAGMDYLSGFHYTYYNSLDEFNIKNPGIKIHYVTRYGKKPHSQFDFTDLNIDYYLMFGRESTGIPLELLANNQETCLRIPMLPSVRSLNLSNCVAIVLYEILRQQDYNGLSKVEVIKGADHLDRAILEVNNKSKED